LKIEVSLKIRYHRSFQLCIRYWACECFIQHEEGTTTTAFFDGVASSDRFSCGAGGVIKITENFVYMWFFNCGGGTNSKVELLGIWASLSLAIFLGIHRLQAFEALQKSLTGS
jgi:hypothetical protein